MEDFFIDKLGNNYDDEEKTGNSETDEVDSFLSNGKIDLFSQLPDKVESNEKKIKKKNVVNIENNYLITSYKDLNKEEKLFSNVDRILEKTTIGPGLEKQYSVPLGKSKKALKLERKRLGTKTKGKKWFDMKATELTEEIKTDLELLKMRSVLDRKHMYKKNDITNVPKYFQVGKIIESPADFYGGRVPKSQRKKTMVEELLADAEFKKYQKKKFKEIMDENRRKKHLKKSSGESKIKRKGKSKK